MEVSQHSKYFCELSGKCAVKRKAVGIWEVKAGEAYTLKHRKCCDSQGYTIHTLREQSKS